MILAHLEMHSHIRDEGSRATNTAVEAYPYVKRERRQIGGCRTVLRAALARTRQHILLIVYVHKLLVLKQEISPHTIIVSQYFVAGYSGQQLSKLISFSQRERALAMDV